MSPARFLITGEPNCGKSALAESWLQSSGIKLTYLATLPTYTCHESRINRHRARRDHQWTTLELIGQLDRDLPTLVALFRQKEPFLLDGLTVYLARSCFQRQQKSGGTLNPILSVLRRELTAHPGPWGFVDTDPTVVHAAGFTELAQITHRCHCLIRSVGGVEYFRLKKEK